MGGMMDVAVSNPGQVKVLNELIKNMQEAMKDLRSIFI